MNSCEEPERSSKEAPSPDAAFLKSSVSYWRGALLWTDGALYNIRQQVRREHGVQLRIYANDPCRRTFT